MNNKLIMVTTFSPVGTTTEKLRPLLPTIGRGINATKFEESKARRHRVYPLGIYHDFLFG